MGINDVNKATKFNRCVKMLMSIRTSSDLASVRHSTIAEIRAVSFGHHNPRDPTEQRESITENYFCD